MCACKSGFVLQRSIPEPASALPCPVCRSWAGVGRCQHIWPGERRHQSGPRGKWKSESVYCSRNTAHPSKTHPTSFSDTVVLWFRKKLPEALKPSQMIWSEPCFRTAAAEHYQHPGSKWPRGGLCQITATCAYISKILGDIKLFIIK